MLLCQTFMRWTLLDFQCSFLETLSIKVWKNCNRKKSKKRRRTAATILNRSIQIWWNPVLVASKQPAFGIVYQALVAIGLICMTWQIQWMQLHPFWFRKTSISKSMLMRTIKIITSRILQEKSRRNRVASGASLQPSQQLDSKLFPLSMIQLLCNSPRKICTRHRKPLV